MIYAFSVEHPSGKVDCILASGADLSDALNKVQSHFRGLTGLHIMQLPADELLDDYYGGVAALTTELNL